jgi:hypothetical protein
MTWFHNNEPIDEIDPSFVGFTYCITNLLDSRKYYGKKKSTFKKTSVKTVKVKSTGLKKKKKTRTLIDSDWRDYYGSSEELKADVEKLGKENFKREILRFCSSLSECSYYELKVQMENDVLLYPNLYYNAYVGCRINRMHMIGKNNSLGIKPKPSSSNVLPKISGRE